MKTFEQIAQDLISDDEFDAIMSRLVADFQISVSQKDATDILPNLIIYTKRSVSTADREIHQIQWEDKESDDAIAQTIASQAYKRKIQVACVFTSRLCEVKTGDIRPGEDLIAKVAENTERHECLFITGMTLDKRMNAGIVFVARDDLGHLFLNNPEIILCSSREEAIVESSLLDKFISTFLHLTASVASVSS